MARTLAENDDVAIEAIELSGKILIVNIVIRGEAIIPLVADQFFALVESDTDFPAEFAGLLANLGIALDSHVESSAIDCLRESLAALQEHSAA